MSHDEGDKMTDLLILIVKRNHDIHPRKLMLTASKQDDNAVCREGSR